MLRRFDTPLFVLLSSLGLWLLGNSVSSWGQTCPALQGCSNTISATADYATIGGGWANVVSDDYATVGGGINNEAQDTATVGGGYANSSTAYAATVGGGSSNSANGNYASVGGGYNNAATIDYATVGGGRNNTATAKWATVNGGGENDATGERSVISGGYNNTASKEYTTIGGGIKNLASGPRATVGGGYLNTASGFGATVPGGGANTALGNYSWAGGLQARAWQKGSFVWADTTGANFPSTAANQFNVRASGGTRIFTNGAATVGVRLLPGSNAWSIASDRALKEDFQDIDKQAVLANVQQLEIQNWKLKDEEGNIRHIGPVAQDFHVAFGLGSDEHFIHTGDAVGVSLVAIQALAERNESLAEQNQALERQVKEFQHQLVEQHRAVAGRVDMLQQENAELRQQLSQVLQQMQALVHEGQDGYRREPILTE